MFKFTMKTASNFLSFWKMVLILIHCVIRWFQSFSFANYFVQFKSAQIIIEMKNKCALFEKRRNLICSIQKYCESLQLTKANSKAYTFSTVLYTNETYKFLSLWIQCHLISCLDFVFASRDKFILHELSLFHLVPIFIMNQFYESPWHHWSISLKFNLIISRKN